MKKVWINRKYLAKVACKWTAGFFSLLGFLGTFVSLSDEIPNTWSLICKILLSIGILVGVWLVFFICCVIWFEKQKWLKVFKANNGCHVYVQYGDVFSENEVDNPNERRNIVIPVNRCFDTIIDNDLVSEKTLHGIAVKKVYEDGIFDETTLNRALQDDLQIRQGIEPETILSTEKRKGNLQRFQVGTIAEVHISNTCTYFLLALSMFDFNLTAHTTQEEYIIAMQRLIAYCNERSQGYPIVMPLIGAGLSRTKNDERSILEFIVSLLKMNKNMINNDIHIVVRNSGKESISITEL